MKAFPGDAGMDEADRAAYLLAGYLRQILTDEEKDELDEWILASPGNMQLFAELSDDHNIEEQLRKINSINTQKALRRAKAKLHRQEDHRRSIRRVLSYAAAASVIITVCLVLFPWHHRRLIPAATPPVSLTPGYHAVLTVENKKPLLLDTIKGIVMQDGNLTISNEPGNLHYSGQDEETTWHTLTTPTGGNYQLTLPDGTMAWLNASSSLRYPTRFTGKDRVVELAGEAYFEVSHDQSKPFLVRLKNNVMVQVLGTHFNIHAYDNEPSIRATLLEGRILLHSPAMETILVPGQQSVVDSSGSIHTLIGVDLESVVAWKKGLFKFSDASIEDIMAQLQRWYGITVEYNAKPDYHFNATMPRSTPLSKLLHYLELTNQVHFTIEDKKVIVSR